MPVVGIAEIEVKPVFKGTQAAIGQMVEGQASSAGTTAGKSMGSKLGSALSASMKVGAGLAVTGLTVALTKGFGRLQAIEQAKAKLTGLGHTADSVTKIMSNASASVKGTAFGLDDAATVAAGAVAAGVKPGKELERTLKLTGDAATIAGVGMSDMGAIFNKVASSNKIQGDVIAQLSDSGIPIVQLLGKELGTTSEETLKLAKEGKINFDTFQKAMEKGMGGAALESGKTLQGAFKNTMASVGRIGANLLTGVYPLFTKFFQGLIVWMEPLEAKAKVVGAAIGVAMETAAKAVGGLYDVLVKGDFTTRFREAFNVEEDSKLVDFLFRVRDGFQTVVGFLKGAGAILLTGNFLGSSVMGFEEDSRIVDFLFRVREGLVSLVTASGQLKFDSWDSFKSSLAEAGGTVGGAFSSIGESLHTLGPAFAEFGRQLPNITGAFVKLGGVSLNFLVLTLGFLADHVDTIIAWMPAIVAGFIAWRIASQMLATAQFSLQAGQVLMTPVITLNNILRMQAVRLEHQHALATGQTTIALNASIVSMVRSKAALIGNNIAMVAGRIAQAGMTVATWAGVAAQKALSLVMSTSPMGILVKVVLLLVAGLVLFFTKTKLGQKIVQIAFAAIKNAIAAVVDWWNNTLVPALKSVGKWFKDVWDGAASAVQIAVRWVQDAIANVIDWISNNWGLLLTIILGPLGFIIQWVVKNWGIISQTVQAVFAQVAAVFTWIYESIIKPVFDAIMVVVNGFYVFFRQIFLIIVEVFKQFVAPAFMNFWHGVVEPVFVGIGILIGMWWSTVSGIFNGVVSFIKTVLGTVFTWLRDSVITPVFNFIAAAVSLWWAAVSLIFNTAIGFIRTVFSAVFTWLRDVIITPVFNGIQNGITLWWTGVKFIFDTVVGFLRTVLGVAFTWLRDTIITPVFNGIRDKISSVWNGGIKPVFDLLSNAIKNDMPKAFNTGVDAVKKAWEKIQEIAKAPVRFVIEKVINGGLIGGMNKLGGLLGIKPLGEVGLPAGFARGGVLGGKSSWRNGDDQLVPMRRGEGVYVSEAMSDPYERARLFAVNKAAMLGQSLRNVRARFGEGFARGGIVNPTKNMGLTQGYHAGHDGIDIGVPTGTPVFATGPGTVNWAGPGVQLPGIWGGNEIHILGDGFERWFGHLSQIGVQLGQKVAAGQQIGLSGNSGITSGPHLHFGVYSGGYPNSVNPLAYLAGAATPQGGSTAGGFFNPLGAITGLADKIAGQLKGAFPMGGFMVDAAAGMGKKMFTSVIDWAKGKLGLGAVAGAEKGAHLNPILYDQGGVLRPGLSTIMNATRKPEAIYTNEQNRALQALAARGARGGDGGDIWHVQLPEKASVGDLMDAVSHQSRVNARGGARR